jgi:putative sterol carrier protein
MINEDIKFQSDNELEDDSQDIGTPTGEVATEGDRVKALETSKTQSSARVIKLSESEIVAVDGSASDHTENDNQVSEEHGLDDSKSGADAEKSRPAPPRRERLKSHYGDHFDRQVRAFEHSLRSTEARERKDRLYGCLNGSIQFYLTGSKDRFFIEGTGTTIAIKDGVVDKPDCLISISARDLQGIIDGNINAQVALISDKVKVEGNTGLAIYAFNLVDL